MHAIFDPDKFGSRIHRAIRTSGLSLRSAATDMGVDAATLCRTANCGVPSVETYLRVVRWLDRQEQEPQRARRVNGGGK